MCWNRRRDRSGELVTCSAEREDELFQMALAVLGQCGIIVRARLRLIRAPKGVAMRAFVYDELRSVSRRSGAPDRGRIARTDERRARREPSGQACFVCMRKLHRNRRRRTPARVDGWTAVQTRLTPTVGSYWDLRRRGADGRHHPGGSQQNRKCFAVRGPADHAVQMRDARPDQCRRLRWHLALRRGKVVARHTRPLHKMPQGRDRFRVPRAPLSASPALPIMLRCLRQTTRCCRGCRRRTARSMRRTVQSYRRSSRQQHFSARPGSNSLGRTFDRIAC